MPESYEQFCLSHPFEAELLRVQLDAVNVDFGSSREEIEEEGGAPYWKYTFYAWAADLMEGEYYDGYYTTSHVLIEGKWTFEDDLSEEQFERLISYYSPDVRPDPER